VANPTVKTIPKIVILMSGRSPIKLENWRERLKAFRLLHLSLLAGDEKQPGKNWGL
jgi:hypothetical protein